MIWQRIESETERGFFVYFTNDQPNTDFSISEHDGKCKIAIHTEANRNGDILSVVFRSLEDAKSYAEELSKTENLCTANRIVDALASFLESSRLLGERQEGSRLG